MENREIINESSFQNKELFELYNKYELNEDIIYKNKKYQLYDMILSKDMCEVSGFGWFPTVEYTKIKVILKNKKTGYILQKEIDINNIEKVGNVWENKELLGE